MKAEPEAAEDEFDIPPARANNLVRHGRRGSAVPEASTRMQFRYRTPKSIEVDENNQELCTKTLRLSTLEKSKPDDPQIAKLGGGQSVEESAGHGRDRRRLR